MPGEDLVEQLGVGAQQGDHVGGNTGLVEGTLASPDDIMISTERMTTIEAIDPDGATMTVQAGVPLETVQNHAAEQGFVFPVDFGARGSAAIGGAISTNAAVSCQTFLGTQPRFTQVPPSSRSSTTIAGPTTPIPA